MSRANFGTSTDITLTAESGSLPAGANARGVTSSLRTSLPKHNKLGVACEFHPRASERRALCHPHLTARLLNSERIGRRSIDLEKGAPRKV